MEVAPAVPLPVQFQPVGVEEAAELEEDGGRS